MGRAAIILGGVFLLALVAGGLTEATLALGHNGRIWDDRLLRLKPEVSPSATPVPQLSASPTPSAVPVVAIPTPTPTSTPAVPMATTNGFVHMRGGASLSASILVDLNAGTKVELLSGGNVQWQQVRYNGLMGYIFKTYLVY